MLVKNIKLMYSGKGETVATDVYTVPASNNESVIKEMFIHNNNTTDVSIVMKIGGSVVADTVVAAKDTLFSEKEWFTVLNPGETINIITGDKTSLDIRISGVETKTIVDA